MTRGRHWVDGAVFLAMMALSSSCVAMVCQQFHHHEQYNNIEILIKNIANIEYLINLLINLLEIHFPFKWF